jgi:hypothetical protein
MRWHLKNRTLQRGLTITSSNTLRVTLADGFWPVCLTFLTTSRKIYL